MICYISNRFCKYRFTETCIRKTHICNIRTGVKFARFEVLCILNSSVHYLNINFTKSTRVLLSIKCRVSFIQTIEYVLVLSSIKYYKYKYTKYLFLLIYNTIVYLIICYVLYYFSHVLKVYVLFITDCLQQFAPL